MVAGGDCFASIDRRLLLQTVCPDSLDVDLDLGGMGPGSGLVGERFLTPQSKLILVGLIAERLALAVALFAARLVHHEGEHAGEDKHRQCGDDDQNHCVGSHIGPLDL